MATTDYMNIEDVMLELDISRPTVTNMIYEQGLKCIKIGRLFKIRRSDLEEWLYKNTLNHDDEYMEDDFNMMNSILKYGFSTVFAVAEMSIEQQLLYNKTLSEYCEATQYNGYVEPYKTGDKRVDKYLYPVMTMIYTCAVKHANGKGKKTTTDDAEKPIKGEKPVEKPVYKITKTAIRKAIKEYEEFIDDNVDEQERAVELMSRPGYNYNGREIMSYEDLRTALVYVIPNDDYRSKKSLFDCLLKISPTTIAFEQIDAFVDEVDEAQNGYIHSGRTFSTIDELAEHFISIADNYA